MALVKGVNSYVTLAEANAYFEHKLDIAAWIDAADSMKEQALVTATAYLDGLVWIGTVVSESQTLAFPRINAEYNDPFLGSIVTLDGNSIPKRVLNACKELAYHFLNNDGILDDTGSVTSLSIGDIRLELPQGASKIPGHVQRSINPLLLNAGALRSWWRAN